MLKVSILVPTFQRCDSVKRLLTALSTQTFPLDDFEVIVSIDGSQDGTREMVEEFSSPYRLHAIWEPNAGRATACNRGIYKAAGDILIILDDDMEPTSELVEAHYSAHSKGSKFGVMGAAPIFIDESSTLAARYIAAEFNSRLEKMSDPVYKFQIRDFYGANFSIRREILIEAGAFNDSFKVYGYEDRELAHRLVNIGVEFVYNSHALCTQYYESDFRGLAKKRIEAGKMAVLLISMHPETFDELRLRNYNSAGWKWRTLRLFLIWSGMLLPITTAAVIFFIKLFEKSDPRIQEKLCSLAMDYFFWLGVWSAVRSDENHKQFLDKIKSFKKPTKSSPPGSIT